MKSNGSKLLVLSFSHLLNDWYSNFIQMLVPFMVATGLSITRSSFLVSAFTVTSSILQPVSGYLVDRRNQRWMVYVGTIWMGVLICLLGIVEDYRIMMIIAAFSGFGTAAFHPQASSMVSTISGDKKGWFQSIFVAGGNVGLALAPLIVIPFVASYGLQSTPILIIPALVSGVMLWASAPKMASKKSNDSASIKEIIRTSWKELTKLVSVVAVRSLAYFGFITFLPLYLKEHEINLEVGSRMLFLMLIAGAIGGIIGGYLSDRFGRKLVIISSLLIATPLFYLFINTTGVLSYILLFLAGGALLSSFSVTVVVAQEIISKNAAMASGLMLGFGIGIGGIGVGLLGIIADAFG
jgi:FSR family fosmidomycin resistance protein-like MFS transporter